MTVLIKNSDRRIAYNFTCEIVNNKRTYIYTVGIIGCAKRNGGIYKAKEKNDCA